MKAVIRKSGRHWVIDRGPNKAMPCCSTKKEAEQLLALGEEWQGTKVLATINGLCYAGKVTNTAICEDGKRLLAVHVKTHGTWWVPVEDCLMVKEENQ